MGINFSFYITINGASKRKEAAWLFLQFVVSKPVQVAVGGPIVAMGRKSVVDDPAFEKGNPWLPEWKQALIENSKYADPYARPVIPEWPEVGDIMGAELESVIAGVKPVEEAVKDADYISLNIPLTDETSGMINKAVIGKMKDGVVIVNTARGKCAVAEDVVECLKSGKIRAYATDVWPSDPPPDDYPILKAPNVVMTPHLGASSKENLLRIGEEVVAIINECKQGGKL